MAQNLQDRVNPQLWYNVENGYVLHTLLYENESSSWVAQQPPKLLAEIAPHMVDVPSYTAADMAEYADAFALPTKEEAEAAKEEWESSRSGLRKFYVSKHDRCEFWIAPQPKGTRAIPYVTVVSHWGFAKYAVWSPATLGLPSPFQKYFDEFDEQYGNLDAYKDLRKQLRPQTDTVWMVVVRDQIARGVQILTAPYSLHINLLSLVTMSPGVSHPFQGRLITCMKQKKDNRTDYVAQASLDPVPWPKEGLHLLKELPSFAQVFEKEVYGWDDGVAFILGAVAADRVPPTRSFTKAGYMGGQIQNSTGLPQQPAVGGAVFQTAHEPAPVPTFAAPVPAGVPPQAGTTPAAVPVAPTTPASPPAAGALPVNYTVGQAAPPPVSTASVQAAIDSLPEA